MYNFSNKNFMSLAKRFKNEIVLRSNRTLTLIEMIKSSEIFTYVHDFTIKNFPEVLNGELKIIPIKDPEPFYQDLWVIWPTSNGLCESASNFIDYVRNEVKK